MIQEISCSPDDELRQLIDGRLSDARCEQVLSHVENCPDCMARLEALEADSSDPLIESLAKISDSDLQRAEEELGLDSDSSSTKKLLGFLGNEFNRKTPTLTLPCQMGPYRIERLIGQGGMGEVYEAWHVRLERPVAIKLIRSSRQEDPATHSHFLKEMTTAGKFDHPNLVRAYDAWDDDGHLYLALELLDGASVKNLASAGKIASTAEIVEIMTGTCKALEHLHHNGLVHCDVKPANVMRLQNSTIKLIDFGLTCSSDPAKTAVRGKAGTKGYMSPEQEDTEQPLDHRTDIYSAGCLLKFLLRHLPKAIDKPYDPESIRFLEAIAQRMSQADPNDRYQTIEDVLTDLERLRHLADRAGKGMLRSGFLWVMLVLVFGGLSVSAWQIVLLTDRNATLVVTNTQPNDVLVLTSDAGEVRSVEVGENPKFVVAPGSYRLTLKTPANRSLSPVAITVASRDHVTVAINGVPKPFELIMVEIPAGQYVMGGPAEAPETLPNELPNRTIEIAKPFKMGMYEVTIAQFREFVTATGYVTEAESTGLGGWKASTASSWGEQSADFCWTKPGYPLADTLPVSVVTYADANAFCEWLSDREGERYRLPTEAEWEYACRAGTTGAFHFPFDSRDSYCWSLWNVKTTVRPRPVGTRHPNAWGLYDMCGNIREWCIDWYADRTYELPYKEFPSGPATGDMRVIRSGCFIDMNGFMMSSHRGYLAPTQAVNTQGFRVVQELP